MEYLNTDAGERIAIPDVVVAASGGRELVAQYCAASPSGRVAIEAQAKVKVASDEAAVAAAQKAAYDKLHAATKAEATASLATVEIDDDE